jgi:asparagine synthase (glutamine-hydrolysing)
VGGRIPEGGSISSVANKARRLSSTLALDGAQRYARYMAWFDAGQRHGLYTPGFAELADNAADDVIGGPWAAASGRAVVDKLLEVDVSTYLVDDLIAKIDIATMAHGLEGRSPLLDHQLMQLAASIPARYKVRGREKKWILRRALRGWLPDSILDRPKQGFTVPLSAWLRSDLRPWAKEVLLDPVSIDRGYFDPQAVRGLLDRHDAGTDGDAKRIWALVMLELWHREFVDARAGATLAVAA